MLRKAEGTFSLSLQCEISATSGRLPQRKGHLGSSLRLISIIFPLRAAAFVNAVLELHAGIGALLHKVVVRRTGAAVGSWRDWLLEDSLVRPHRWLTSDVVPPSHFLECDPALTPDGSGVPSGPARIDEEFRKALLSYFSLSVREHAWLSDFEREVEGWLRLSERRFACLL